MPMLIPLIVAYGASALAEYAIGSAIAGAVVGAIAGSVAAKALTPKPSQQNMQSQGQGIVVNRSANNDPLNHVYGLRRVGGTVGVPGAHANYLGLVVAHGVGAVDRVARLYVDGQPTWLPKFRQNYNYWKSYTGAAGQQADPVLIAQYPGLWTANHRGDSVAYTAAFLFANVALFPSAPTLAADIFGELFYDPRDSGTRFSHNAALGIRKFLTTSREDGGGGIDSSLIDDADTFISSANHCEERVTIDWPTFTASTTTDRLTFSTPQALRAGDSVLVSSGGTLPAPLAAGTAYYAIPVDETSIQLATSYSNALAGTAIDLTTAGSGTHTLKRVVFCIMEPERAWYPDASASGYQICFYAQPPTPYIAVDQPYWLGDGVQLASTVSLPTGLSAGVTYYIIPNGVSSGQDAAGNYGQGVNCVRLASTYANAIAGTAISLTDTGSGNITLWHVDQERYTCDGIVNVDNDRMTNLEQLLTACRGFLFFSGGKYKLKCDRADTPTGFVFNESNILGGWELGLGGKRTIYNRVSATFFDPVAGWQANEAISDSDDDRTNSDNDLLLQTTIDLPFTANVFRAQRIAQIERKQSRFSRVASFTANNAAMECEIGDVVYMTHPTPSWVNKTVRITDMEPLNSDEVKVTVREYDSSVYTVDPTTHVSPPLPGGVPRGPNYWATIIPPDVTGLEIFGQGNGSSFTGRDCKFTWRRGSNTGSYELGNEPYGADAGLMDTTFKDYQVQVYNGATLLRTEYVQDPACIYTWEKNNEDNAGVPLRSFTVKVRQRSDYEQYSAIAAQLTASNPAPVISGVTLAANPGGFGYFFTSPTDGDYQGTEIHASLTSGFSPGPTTLQAKVPGLPNANNQGQVTGLQPGVTWYVRLVPYDAFGAGSTTAESSVTTQTLQTSTQAGAVGATGTLQQIVTSGLLTAFSSLDFGSTSYAPNTQTLLLAGVLSGANWNLAAYDLRTLALVKMCDLGYSSNFGGFCYSPTTGLVYVSINGFVVVVDPKTMTVSGSYATPSSHVYVWLAHCPSDGKMYLADARRITAFDTGAHTFATELDLGAFSVQGIMDLAYFPAANQMVASWDEASLKKITLTNPPTVATTQACTTPNRIAYCPADGRMWCNGSNMERLKSDGTLDTNAGAGNFSYRPVWNSVNSCMYAGIGNWWSPLTLSQIGNTGLFTSVTDEFFHSGLQMLYGIDTSGGDSLVGYSI